jgi:hypothetical protein
MQQAGSSDEQKNSNGEKRGRTAIVTEESIRAALAVLGVFAPQEKLAEHLGVDARAIRDWQKARGLTYLQLRQRYSSTGRN